MVKHSVHSFSPKGLTLDERFYTGREIDHIIQRANGLPEGQIEHTRAASDGTRLITIMVPRREALVERLETAAQVWCIESEFQTKPTDKQLGERCGAIETAAKRLLETLGGSDRDRMPPALFGALKTHAAAEAERLGGFPEWTDEGLLERAVSGICDLRNWASAAREQSEAQSTTPQDERHSGDKALDGLFANLVGILIDVFQRVPGTSVNAKGKSGGPMIRFLSASLRPLLGDNSPSDDAIRARLLRVNKSTSNNS